MPERDAYAGSILIGKQKGKGYWSARTENYL